MASLSAFDRFQRRLEERRIESGFKPLQPPLPPPSKIQYGEWTFNDTPEAHGMTPAMYSVTLGSIHENMKVFMQRRFSAAGDAPDDAHTIADAPMLLANYLEVESLVRGFRYLPTSVRFHLLDAVLVEWGFQYNGVAFTLGRRHIHLLDAEGAAGPAPLPFDKAG